jgi:hypothetical protein
MADGHKALGYQFGPLERRGVMLGLGASQLITLAGGGLATLLELRAVPSTPGGALAVMILLATAAASLWPLGGRPPVAWLPLLLAYWVRWACRRHRFTSRAHLSGHLISVNAAGAVLEALPPEERPASVRHLRILEVAASELSSTGFDAPLGVIASPRRHTYIGVLRVSGGRFGLLDEAEQAAAAQAWGSILAGFAVESSPVARLQWIERTLPDDGQAVARDFGRRAADDAPGAALRIYQDAINRASEMGVQHECLLALVIDARRSWREIRRRGGGDLDLGACLLLWQELASLRTRLEAVGITTDARLTPRALAEVIRSQYEPQARPHLRLIHGLSPEHGPHPRNAWPQSASECFSHFQAGERSFHATYHVREWPRIEVGPDFLAPLLTHTRALRTVSMTLQPIPAVQAARELRRALASDVSDDTLRAKGGWLTSIRQLRERDNVQRAEQELADGHASYRFTAYVTVSAGSLEELESTCAEVEQAASQAHLELERLFSQQELAFTYTLPLGEGLR